MFTIQEAATQDLIIRRGTHEASERILYTRNFNVVRKRSFFFLIHALATQLREIEFSAIYVLSFFCLICLKYYMFGWIHL